MDSSVKKRLATFRAKKNKNIHLHRADSEPLVIGYRTDARERNTYPPNEERELHEPGLAAASKSRPVETGKPFLKHSYTLGPRLGRASFAFELQTYLLHYPAFNNLAGDPMQLVHMAEYHDFLHQVVNESFRDSRRGLGLGFNLIANRPWLRYFHLVADINTHVFPDVGAVAKADPNQVDWERPVKTDIEMHWLTPIAKDWAFGIRVVTNLDECRKVETIDANSVRKLGDTVAATLQVEPDVELAALANICDSGHAGDENSFCWPGKRDSISIKPVPVELELEDGTSETYYDITDSLNEAANWETISTAFFNPQPCFDFRDPAGSIQTVSPERVLDTQQQRVRTYLRNQTEVVAQWRAILERLGVTPTQFLGDSETLIL